jgi:hypothetical protein
MTRGCYYFGKGKPAVLLDFGNLRRETNRLFVEERSNVQVVAFFGFALPVRQVRIPVPVVLKIHQEPPHQFDRSVDVYFRFEFFHTSQRVKLVFLPAAASPPGCCHTANVRNFAGSGAFRSAFSERYFLNAVG